MIPNKEESEQTYFTDGNKEMLIDFLKVTYWGKIKKCKGELASPNICYIPF